MPARRKSVPSYLLHEKSGSAYTYIKTPSGGRRQVWLGKHGGNESRLEYGRLLRQVELGHVPERGPIGITMAELCLRFLQHAEIYYRDPSGRPSSEVGHYRSAVGLVVAIYPELPVEEFGPLAFKAVRESMIRRGWVRKTVNSQAGRVRRMVKWGVENELVDARRWESLRAVAGLAIGRSGAPEGEPVLPAPEADVLATLPHLPATVAAMVRFQLLTGCRPQDACRLRGSEIDRSAAVWVYRPAKHKGSWRGKERRVYIGPEAQALLQPWLESAGQGVVFSARRAVEAFHRQRAAERVTKLYPSHARHNAERKAEKPKRTPGEAYTTESYGRAVANGCAKAGVAAWSVGQLRHNAGTRFREIFGIELTRELLGHSSAVTSEIYALPSIAAAKEAMARVG